VVAVVGVVGMMVAGVMVVVGCILLRPIEVLGRFDSKGRAVDCFDRMDVAGGGEIAVGTGFALVPSSFAVVYDLALPAMDYSLAPSRILAVVGRCHGIVDLTCWVFFDVN
jgi:hypothetical protein